MVDVRRGFTLIELLIVISIIALLSLIGLVAYSEFLKTARNNKRLSDLKLIQSALEDYHADQLYYPYLNPACTGGFHALCASGLRMGTKIY